MELKCQGKKATLCHLPRQKMNCMVGFGIKAGYLEGPIDLYKSECYHKVTCSFYYLQSSAGALAINNHGSGFF